MDKLIFVRKKKGFRDAEKAALSSLNRLPGIKLQKLALFNIYAVSEATPEEYECLSRRILSDPLVDEVLTSEEVKEFAQGGDSLGISSLEGQYDQRRDAAEQCLRLFFPESELRVHSSVFYFFDRKLSEAERKTLRLQLINPLENREVKLSDWLEAEAAGRPVFPAEDSSRCEKVPVYTGFCELDEAGLENFIREHGLAMNVDDLRLIRDEFRREKREPNDLEIKVLDTYWSDHCRHTTFNTELCDISNESHRFKDELDASLARYKALRQANGRSEKPLCLMDIATIMSRELRRRGLLKEQEISNEINACSVRIKAERLSDGVKEPWLLMFKNETHNHPTEIEPYGGAATCLGGAIRDPLSGRAWVYQALRLSGAGDINTPLEATLPGKLPQREISLRAARGFSSYGNQIGLASTKVRELFHPGYVAKHMEVGAVVAAVPEARLRRAEPRPGDRVLLLGGRTGRDGVGGATGSSKAHTEASLSHCGSEVQKGNPVNERKLQRLFRRADVAPLIRSCNDFGAGGVAVAVGELADGLSIHLERVPLKYAGLSLMEIAVSESQERMAVLLAPQDVAAFIAAAHEENLEATEIAEVTAERRLRMFMGKQVVLDLSREFLNTNGAPRRQRVRLCDPEKASWQEPSPCTARNLQRVTLLDWFKQANHGLQQGLVEQFDASIGRSTVLFPYGGRYQASEEAVSAQTLPMDGGSSTASLLAYGFRPELADISPYLMGAYSTVEAVSVLVAAGADPAHIYLSCQEYFRRLDQQEEAWGEVLQALLGSLDAQDAFAIAAIGGKDSMSGSFEKWHVPPTLVSFGVAAVPASDVLSATLPPLKAGQTLYLYYLPHRPLANACPDYAALRHLYKSFHAMQATGTVVAASSERPGGLAVTLAKMALGNRVGLRLSKECAGLELLNNAPGGLVYASFLPPEELPEEAGSVTRLLLAKSDAQVDGIAWNENVLTTFDEMQAALGWAYNRVFPPLGAENTEDCSLSRDVLTGQACAPKKLTANSEEFCADKKDNLNPENSKGLCMDGAKGFAPALPHLSSGNRSEGPVHVLLPVFPGTNCEFDTAEAFRAAGADCEMLLIRNLTPEMAAADLRSFLKKLKRSQILALSGGFSFGDEPDGSAKFIVNFLKTPAVTAAILEFVREDGLVLGICNGFQALLKSGFLPYGNPDKQRADSPTLFFNQQGRHISRMARTQLCTDPGRSPWLDGLCPGQIDIVPVSHGEGRFLVSEAEAQQLFARGQVAFRYVDEHNHIAGSAPWNPNGSAYAVEGLISEDGHILGKMGHSERVREGLFKNIPGIGVQKIFANAVRYCRQRKIQF